MRGRKGKREIEKRERERGGERESERERKEKWERLRRNRGQKSNSRVKDCKKTKGKKQIIKHFFGGQFLAKKRVFWTPFFAFSWEK